MHPWAETLLATVSFAPPGKVEKADENSLNYKIDRWLGKLMIWGIIVIFFGSVISSIVKG